MEMFIYTNHTTKGGAEDLAKRIFVDAPCEIQEIRTNLGYWGENKGFYVISAEWGDDLDTYFWFTARIERDDVYQEIHRHDW